MLKRNFNFNLAFIFIFLFFSSLVLFAKYNSAQACTGRFSCPTTTPPVEKVCPPGDVKYNVGSGYEYTDGSANVTIHPGTCCKKNSVSWQANECYEVESVCVKIGGPGGGSLINPDPSAGSSGPHNYDISHVVLTSRNICEPEPTPTEPEPTPTIPEKPTPTLKEPTPTSPPSDNGRGGPAGAPICGAETTGAPYLVSATAMGGNKIEIKWQKVEKASHYTISYGPTSGNYPWGVPNTGNTDSFIIEGVSSGCFIVRAVNDCAPSEPSNEVCTGQVLGQVLGLSTTSSEKNTSNTPVFWAGFLMLVSGSVLIMKEKLHNLRG